MKPCALTGNIFFHLRPVLARHRLKRRRATAFHDVEAQTSTNKVQVLHYLAVSVNSLDHDACKGLAVEAGTMEHEAEPVEERLHGRRNLERVIRGCEDDSIGRHELFDEHVPIILQRAVFLASDEAQLAAPA